MSLHTKIYVDSRCRDSGLYHFAHTFHVDLIKPLMNVKEINVIQCTIPVFPPVNWQEQNKHAAIVLRGYRADVAQILPNQYPSDTSAIIPLVTATAAPAAWTFHDQIGDNKLWKCDEQRDFNVPRLDRIDIRLVTTNPLTGAAIDYPFLVDDYSVQQNWTMVLDVTSYLGQR